MQIYQIQISLKGINPKIWRRILIPSDLGMPEFHEVMMLAMGWAGYHQHKYINGKKMYSGATEENDMPEIANCINYEEMTIADFLVNENDLFLLAYDFNDGWMHEINLEKILPFNDKQLLPFCIDGDMNCPPDDCGGITGYAAMLKLLKQPKHPEYKEMMEWLGGEFDPMYFNKEDLNGIFR